MNDKKSGFWGTVSQISDPYIFLFSITLFLSAALTFTIQPMVGKMLLPLVGGTPSGWLVTMVYFQMALLAGYAIAHLLSRTKVLTHITVVIVLLLAGVLMFPIRLKAEIIDSSGLPEALGVLVTLFLSLTLPCVALFTLSPTMQRLFEAGSSSTKRDPYFLFAASNLGSLGGLLAYPLLIERISGLSAQTHGWQKRYEILIGLCITCLLFAYRQIRNVREMEKPITAPAIDWRTRGRWLLLAFIPSSLMLGVTEHVTSDLGAVPFFWVLPLALYLLTFILAFAKRQAFGLARIGFLQAGSVALMMAFFIKEPAIGSSPEQMVFPTIAFCLTAIYCHFTLASKLPDTQRLTEFYLWIATGGALGGLFNTFVVPFLFPLPFEFVLVVLLSCLIHPEKPQLNNPKIRRLIAIAAIVAVVPAIISAADVFGRDKYWIENVVTMAVLVLSLLVLSISPRVLVGFSLIAGLFAVSMHNTHLLDVHRDFFGVLRVFRDRHIPGMTVRTIYHGSTLHGLEKVGPEIDTTPHAYYEASLADVFTLYTPMDVGLLGLGAGTILCYQAPGRQYTVYELDPAVPAIAKKWFDYMRVCGNPKMIIGDGRRAITAAKDTRHDLLIMDAFTSDAIPIQLITREAVQLYFERLKPEGILAIHISNRFYDLRQPISNVVSSLGLHGLYETLIQPPSKPLAISSRWAVVARTDSQLEPLRKQGWQDLPPPEGRPWTDDFSEVLSALEILQPKAKETHAETH